MVHPQARGVLGASRPRSWRKVHLGIDAATMEVRAIEGEQASATGPREPANGSRIGDGPMLPDLLAQIPAEEPIGLVTADGAYDIRSCHAVLSRGPVTRSCHAVLSRGHCCS